MKKLSILSIIFALAMILTFANSNPIAAQQTVEDQYWDLVKNSTFTEDFQSYLEEYPNGKYKAIALLKINRDPAPPNSGGTIEDQFWNRIKNSKNPNDFRSYLTNFPGGKYAPLARLELSRLTGGGTTNPPPPTLSSDDKEWDRIKNSNDARDFQNYLSAFPNGNHKRDAQFKIIQIKQEQAKADFLRNAQFGSLNEISNKRRVFITATDFNSRNRIVSELQKEVPSLIIVGNQQNADFFIEYKLTISSACDPGTSTAANACELHTGEMWVHTKVFVSNGSQFNYILWNTTKTKSYSSAGINFFDKNPAAQAADDLAKQLKNLGF